MSIVRETVAPVEAVAGAPVQPRQNEELTVARTQIKASCESLPCSRLLSWSQ
jgi:hypothetical protein